MNATVTIPLEFFNTLRYAVTDAAREYRYMIAEKQIRSAVTKERIKGWEETEKKFMRILGEMDLHQ